MIKVHNKNHIKLPKELNKKYFYLKQYEVDNNKTALIIYIIFHIPAHYIKIQDKIFIAILKYHLIMKGGYKEG